MDETPLELMLKLITEHKLLKLDVMCLYNTASCYLSGVPTGTTRSTIKSKHTP